MDPLWSYPTGWANPQTVRASAALPAAGAWDATPTELVSDYATHLLLNFTYTRHAQSVLGVFDWQLETSIYSVAALVPAGASEWVTEPLVAGGLVVLNADSQSHTQRNYNTYGATGAEAEDFHFDIDLLGNVERYRVRARESADGDTDNPGTLAIVGELRIR